MELLKKYWKVLLFLSFFVIYLLTQHIVFGILTLITMLWLVFEEIKNGVHSRGWKHEAIETLISVILVVAFWYGLIILLDTSTPISAVVTCSMLPNLERGDLVFVQGGEASTYSIEMNSEEFKEVDSFESAVKYKDGEYIVKGSMYTYCAQNTDPLCNNFIFEPWEFTEEKGPLTFKYSQCYIDTKDGTRIPDPCVTSVEFKGKEYPINLSNDIIVYRPSEGSYFSLIGDIIHRTYFKINVGDEIYYLTKGDNNQIFDIQIYGYSYDVGNHPIHSSNVNGKKIFSIPYIGYLKLILSGFFDAPAQCDNVLDYTYVN